MNGDVERKELRFAPSGEIDCYEYLFRDFFIDILNMDPGDADSVFVSDPLRRLRRSAFAA
jgi:hypothetical protein